MDKKSVKNAFEKVHGNESSEAKESALALDVPINLVGTEEEKNRLTKITNRMTKSSFGKDTLEIAAEAGYSICFVDGLPGLGVCDRHEKTISLGSSFNDDMLVMALSHEARHAGQFIREPWLDDIEHDSLKAQIMVSRAIEADAQSVSCMVCWELMQQGDRDVYGNFRSVNRLISRRFEKELRKKDADVGKAMTEAFEGWYDNDQLKSAYEEIYYVDRLSAICRDGYGAELKMDRNLTGKELVDKVCFAGKDVIYFTGDPKMLECGSFLDVNDKTMSYFKRFMKERKEKYGLDADKTLEEIPLRDNRYDAYSKNKENHSSDEFKERQKNARTKIDERKDDRRNAREKLRARSAIKAQASR